MTRLYRCRMCGKWYLSFPVQVSCCVAHPPGDCCHAFEIQVTKKGKPKGKH